MIETDVAHQLRNAADKMHIAPLAQSELILMLRLAADEADRFYNGMMAWKQTAQTKDAKLSQEMTDRINERVAARLAAAPAPSAPKSFDPMTLQPEPHPPHRGCECAGCQTYFYS